MRNDCEICGGSGIVRLPVRQRLDVYSKLSDKDVSLSIREYSCPECGGTIPQENVMICQVEDLINSEESKIPDFMEYCQRNMALKLGDFLHKENLITFSKKKAEKEMSWRDMYLIRAKLGVISPRTVATFEQRVNQRQMTIAKAVANEAVKQIRNWNSYYDKGNGAIAKDMAIRQIYESLQKIDKEVT